MGCEEWNAFNGNNNYSSLGGGDGASYNKGYFQSSVVTGGKNCKHTGEAVKVGTFQLYAGANRSLTKEIRANFDVISPLVTSLMMADFAGCFGMIVAFPITDYGSPDPDQLRIHAKRLNELAAKGARVLVYCEGSHGRTGLVLATCIGLAEPDTDPIDAVRERHCKHACETYGQIETVFKALGREVPEQWKKPSVTPTWVKEDKSIWGEYGDYDYGKYRAHEMEGKTCEYCKNGDLEGNLLHWFGVKVAHTACWEDAHKAVAAAETVGGTTPQGTTVLPVRQAKDVPSHKETEQKKRPFSKGWTKGQRRKFKDVSNAYSDDGDILCMVCDGIIEKAEEADILEKVAVHCDCLEQNDEYCEQCGEPCDSKSGFCSERCQALFLLEEEQNGEVVNERAEGTTSPDAVVPQITMTNKPCLNCQRPTDSTDQCCSPGCKAKVVDPVLDTSPVVGKDFQPCLTCGKPTNWSDGFCTNYCKFNRFKELNGKHT